MTTQNKPRPHAELIKAWADGAEIEYLLDGVWKRVPNPQWYPDGEYRVKPKVYPKSTLPVDTSLALWHGCAAGEFIGDVFEKVADAAVAHFIQNDMDSYVKSEGLYGAA